MKYLPKLSQQNNDPMVGMIGASYGGGVQLLASIQDSRINAIVPMVTWHSLPASVAPSRHIKTMWTYSLVTGGMITSGFDMNIFDNAHLSSAFGVLHPDLQKKYYQHSPAFFCEQGQYPQADTLLIQGMHDTIFPLNEAVKNKLCIEKNNKDVRLLGIQDGHYMMFFQQWQGFPYFHIEDEIHCGKKTLNTIEIILSWWDEKLKGISSAANNIPTMCITLSHEKGVNLTSLPQANNYFSVPKTTVKPGLSGLFEWVLQPLDRLIGWTRSNLQKTPSVTKESLGGFFRPAFVPLKTVGQDSYIIGIPHGNLTLKSNATIVKPVVLAGIGRKRPHSRYIELINEQVIPIVDKGNHQVEFSAISSELKKNDVVGLVLYGIHGQYVLNSSRWPTGATIEGEVYLPTVLSLP